MENGKLIAEISWASQTAADQCNTALHLAT